MSYFTHICKELRLEAGLTQQELAPKIGISSSAIGMLEKGYREPTGSTLLAYANYFGVSIDYLMGREQNDYGYYQTLPDKKQAPISAPIMNRIKDLREENNLTQTDLATAVSTSQRNISRWEKGEIEMGANFALAIAKYFNVSVEYLLGSSAENDFPLIVNNVDNRKNPITDRPPSDIVTEKFIDEFKDLFSEKTFRQYTQLYRAMDRDTRIFVLGYICSYLKSIGMNVESVLK